jgi:flagellar basal-body rod protein FlgC
VFPFFDISTSALVAQRTRLAVISNNIANLSTTRNELGQTQPYQPRYTVFETSGVAGGPRGTSGVRVGAVVEDDVEPRWKYQPGHPDAIQAGDRRGYVAYPNVNLMAEVTDALEATRAYEANIGIIEVSRDLAQQTLRIVA